MNKKGLSIARYVMSVLLLCAIGAIAFSLCKTVTAGATALVYGYFAVHICTCAFAIWYLLMGCKKKVGAVLFQIFLSLFAFSSLLAIMCRSDGAQVDVFLIAFRILVLIVLAAVLDFGEKKSKWAAGLIIFCTLVSLVLSLALKNFMPIISILCDLVLGASAYVMICGKYADKKARGSK